MKRKVYDKLVEWKKQNSGKTALLIEGARRVGKSYIAEEFAKNNYRSYILIDFSKANDKVKDLFNQYLDTPYIIHTGDYKEEKGIVYLPVYMTGLLG